MRPRPRSLSQGSISVVLLGVLSVVALFAGVIFSVAEGLLIQARLDGVADSGALAASDLRRGVSGGDPCTVAGEIARLASARLEICRIVEDCVLVQVASDHLFWVLRAAALAGPP